MTAVIVRILLRYGSGALVLHGVLSPDDGNAIVTDPDVAQLLEIGVGLGMGAISEGWYYLAHKFGWQK